MLHVADAAPTPAELIEDLRLRLGQDGRPLSDDRLAAMIGATRQQVIRWRKHGRGMTRPYAEKLAELDGEHPPEAFMRPTPAVTAGQAEVLERLAKIDETLSDLVRVTPLRDPSAEQNLQRMLDLVAAQLEQQSLLLEQLSRVAARLEASARRRGRGAPE